MSGFSVSAPWSSGLLAPGLCCCRVLHILCPLRSLRGGTLSPWVVLSFATTLKISLTHDSPLMASRDASSFLHLPNIFRVWLFFTHPLLPPLTSHCNLLPGLLWQPLTGLPVSNVAPPTVYFSTLQPVILTVHSCPSAENSLVAPDFTLNQRRRLEKDLKVFAALTSFLMPPLHLLYFTHT